MSVIDLMLPLNQLLNNDPPNIDPTPIHKNGSIPETKGPTITLSLVIPSTVAIPPIKSKIPGTPRKNFEYFESKAIAFKYLPKTAYEYSTLLLARMTTLRTETMGNTF